MKHVRLWGVGIGLCVGAGLLTWHLAFSQSTGSAELIFGSCGLSSLNGRYLFDAEGRYGETRVHQAGFEVYYGDGTMEGVYSQSENGAIGRNIPYNGTYTINSDCTGALTTTDIGSGSVAHYDQFLGPKGDEFSWVQTDPDTGVAGFERRVQ